MAVADRDYLVELQALGECILDYSKISSGSLEILNSSKESINGLYDVGWQGEAKESFKEKFDTWINDVEAFNKNMNELENALKVMYEKVTELKDEGGNLSNFL